MRIEWIPLGVNCVCFAYYLLKGSEPGKLCYWLGAILITVGLLKMKG